MSSKSHRQKALQSLIDAGPSTSAGQLLPPDTLVTVDASKKTKKTKKGSKKLGSSLKSSKGKEKESEREGEVADEGEQAEGDEKEWAGNMDVEMGADAEDDSEMLIDDGAAAPSAESEADRLLLSHSSKPTPVKLASGEASLSSSSQFAPLKGSAAQLGVLRSEQRRVTIPPHRMTPLKKEWVNVYGPLVEMMGLMVRMNVPKKCVELKVSRRSGWLFTTRERR